MDFLNFLCKDILSICLFAKMTSVGSLEGKQFFLLKIVRYRRGGTDEMDFAYAILGSQM